MSTFPTFLPFSTTPERIRKKQKKKSDVDVPTMAKVQEYKQKNMNLKNEIKVQK